MHPRDRAAWRAWLERHHADSSGVWLVRFRKGAGEPGIEYADAVEEALSFGWIDSKQKTLDEERSLLWMCPRKPTSRWSKVNKERIEQLEQRGLMAEAGRRAVAAAKTNGAWTALDDVEELALPDDLAAALGHDGRAKANYEAFPPSSKKIILTWIASAKRPQTRAKRIAETARLAAQNVRANHYRR